MEPDVQKTKRNIRSAGWQKPIVGVKSESFNARMGTATP